MEELINKFDQSNLYSVIEKLPEQLLQAWDFTSTKFSSTPDKIFISGIIYLLWNNLMCFLQMV